MELYLDRSESLEVDVVKLEGSPLGPDEQDVDIRHIALNARGEQQQWLFHFVREILVATVALG